MSLSLAFSNTWAGHFLMAALVFAALKVIAAVVQHALTHGDYRRPPDTLLFRAVYFTGKATPALAAVCACIVAVLRHDMARSWFYGLLATFVALLALYVVRLRRQGKFFGAFDALSRKRARRPEPD